jgi:hypothetical protein
MVKIISLCGWAWKQIIFAKVLKRSTHPPPLLEIHLPTTTWGFTHNRTPLKWMKACPLPAPHGRGMRGPSWQFVSTNPPQARSILSACQWIHPKFVPSSVHPDVSILSSFHLKFVLVNPSWAHSSPKPCPSSRTPPPIHSISARPLRPSTPAFFFPPLLLGFHKRVQGLKLFPPIHGHLTESH